MNKIVFKRASDNGHASLFASRLVAGRLLTIEIRRFFGGTEKVVTTLKKQDVEEYIKFLQAKYKLMKD